MSYGYLHLHASLIHNHTCVCLLDASLYICISDFVSHASTQHSVATYFKLWAIFKLIRLGLYRVMGKYMNVINLWRLDNKRAYITSWFTEIFCTGPYHNYLLNSLKLWMKQKTQKKLVSLID